MVYRYTGIAAATILAFAFTQLNGLLRPTVDGPPWQFVILAGLALGAVITWTGITYRLSSWVVAGINAAAFAVVGLRIATPETLVFLFPTADSWSALQRQLDQAMAIIRNGIEPVIPVSGLVVIVTAVFWGVGAITSYALLRGRPALAVVPGLVLSLQFATMDRNPTGTMRLVIFLVLLAAAVLAVTSDERANTSGRMAHASGWRPSRNFVGAATGAALAVTLVASLLAVGTFRNSVPYDGVVAWRAATGLTGDFFGSVSYNAFATIQQSLVTNTTTPLFFAEIEGDVPTEGVYFRMLTLETYAGGRFFADRPEVQPLENATWEEPGHAFAGPTTDVKTTIVIRNLATEWMPAAYTPVFVGGEAALIGSLVVRKDDGSLRLQGGQSYPDQVYTVESRVPLPDLATLSTGIDGELSPLFAAAAADEAPVPTPVVSRLRPEPPDAEVFLQLPEDLDAGIAELAREKTQNLATPFEIGLALESWFRSSDFTYTTDIPPGYGATDLADWLLDPESPFSRAGYCENFATSMAVMARTLGIPSRVVLGFTPGEDTVDENVVVVRDRNAHAWVELWMPSQGWVRFDPTPRPDRINPTTSSEVTAALGFDPVDYFEDIPDPIFAFNDVPPTFFNPRDILDEDLSLDPALLDGPLGGTGGGLPGWVRPIAVVLLAAGLLIGALPLLKLWQRRRRMARLRNGDITAAWEDIVARLEDFGERPAPTMTPDELAASVDPAMQPLAAVYGRAVYGPPAAADDALVTAATRSLEQTATRLSGRYSKRQRIVAWYRLTSVVPERWRNALARRR